jgi:hypothetical protein
MTCTGKACITGVVYTRDAYITGINDTGEAGIIFGLLLAAINDTTEVWRRQFKQHWSDMKLIWYGTHLIPNLFHNELIWFQTYLISNLFDIKLIW